MHRLRNVCGMVSILGGLVDDVCVRSSDWAPFEFRVARAAFRAACFSSSPIRVRIVVDPVLVASNASVINVLAGCLWLLLAWTRKVDTRHPSNILRLIALSRCVNASYWGSISIPRLLSCRALNSSSVSRVKDSLCYSLCEVLTWKVFV
jgi:hypothetical protein